jgi:hypothetical protein
MDLDDDIIHRFSGSDHGNTVTWKQNTTKLSEGSVNAIVIGSPVTFAITIAPLFFLHPYP